MANPAVYSRIMPNDHSLRVYDSMLGLLSNEENPTPLVRLQKVVPYEHTQVYAKLEWYNPFGAVKDRVAANLVHDAEQRGLLGPGNKLVEATSGNTGLGLAMIGNAKGYALRTPLSKGIPLEKRTVLRFFRHGCGGVGRFVVPSAWRARRGDRSGSRNG